MVTPEKRGQVGCSGCHDTGRVSPGLYLEEARLVMEVYRSGSCQDSAITLEILTDILVQIIANKV